MNKAAIRLDSRDRRDECRGENGDREAHEVRVRDELIGAMCHDMRSPIGAIGIFCEILQAGSNKLDANQERLVGMIGEAAAKLQRVLEDASELARLHSRRFEIHRAPVDMHEIMQAVMDELCPFAAGPEIRLSREFSASSTRMRADRIRIHAVLHRLLREAVASLGEGGELIITDDTCDGRYVLLVKALPDLAVTPVASVSPAAPRIPHGALGARIHGPAPYDLPTCQRVIEAHGGALNLCWRRGFEARLSLALESESAHDQLPRGDSST